MNDHEALEAISRIIYGPQDAIHARWEVSEVIRRQIGEPEHRGLLGSKAPPLIRNDPNPTALPLFD